MSDQNLKAPTFIELLARIAKESALVLVLGVCCYLMLAIAGYDSRDPGWSHLGYQPQVDNLAGAAGAWVADLLYSVCGLAAWAVPPLLAWPSLRFLMRRGVSLLDGIPFLILRASGALLFLASFCALASMHFSNRELEYPFTAGGLVGQALSDWTVSWFSIAGSSVVLWTLMLLGLTWYLEVSWRQALEWLGGSLVSGWERVQSLFTEAGEGLRQRRARRSERPVAKVKPSQEPPRTSLSSVRVRRQEPPEQEPLFLTEAPVPEARIEPGFAFEREPVETPAASAAAEDVPPWAAEPFPQHEEPAREPRQAPPQYAPEEVREPAAAAAQPAGAPSSEAGQGGPRAVSGLVDEVVERFSDTGDVAAPAPGPAAPVPEAEPRPAAVAEATRKGVRIVPLAEAHRPMQDSDLGLDHDQARGQTRPSRIAVPSLDLLDPPELHQDAGYTDEQLEHMSRLLESKLKDFGVVAEVVEVNPGPVITRFELQPAPGVKASKITNLSKDLARSMAVLSVRVVEVIPGKSVIGIEIPNESRQMVRLSEVLNSKPYNEASSKLTLGLGNDIAGNPVVANLAKMPHLLVAGTTGSGKSVGVNAMLLSLLFKATPDEVRLMMVDPKMLELSIYEGIPHLLTPVITDMKEAAGGLRWCVAEMERRYKLMAKMGVRNISGFNDKVVKARDQGQPLRDPLWNPEQEGMPQDTPAPELDTMPYIVVVIDEFADMMMIVGKKVEELIARIAQKARAAGIHLILATQRPSVDVITGLIKANVPTRIAFQVSSKIDSRTILDQSGAENLLGNGDMLYLPAGVSVPNRVHGAFVSDDEVHRIVEAWKAYGAPEYIDEILAEPGAEAGAGGGGGGGLFDDEQDPLYDEAVAFVTESRKASISSVQRKLKIGYNRAARMIETMEEAGVVTPAGSNGQREVIAPPPPRD
ncbi:hypothetical protein GCM10011348_05210 [Marinobacterium nitratireducens]|uniref:DNA translocase FtsK n=1 Tax=Marinobacterium nitratireducens TaxID=518897 RepID=A0A918DPT6_9GAMM|nr:DNA translocase FtsK [Marinobacterium nitratireducens]GGO76902.1 hypothetical protein GCM10011348_05210 [Marinobacterium nitratireducens]